MLKARLMLMIAFFLFIALVLWWFIPFKDLPFMEVIVTIAISVMVFTFLIEGINKIKDSRKKLAGDDEYSKNAEHKAGYYSYLTSVFIWVALYFLKDRFDQVAYLLSTGILCMAVVFVALRIYYRNKGEL